MPANQPVQTTAPALLLEREAEIAALEAMLDAAQSGDGRLVIVEGSAGIGKTRLLAEARALASAAGFEVLTARGGELEGQFAFGIVRQLFEAPLAGANPEMRAELLAGAAGLSASLFASAPTTASGEGTESAFAVLHGLYWLAANFASRRPALLVVDDLHWADEPSLRWLIYFARRLEGLPLLLLVGTRPALQADFPALVAELLADSVGAVIRPGSLGEESAALLARSRLGAEPDPLFTAALQTGSGGNPLFLLALLDALSREEAAPTADRAAHVLELGPHAISRGIAARLTRLPSESTALLRAAATLGDRTELSLAASLADIEAKTALSAASALVRVDLLSRENPLEFTHPVVRTAVLETMSAAERTQAHRRAAEVILGAGGLPDQTATHLMLAIPDRDDFVVATLRQAAAHALAQGAAPAAAAYLRRALAEPPRPEERARVLYELGVAELQSGAAESARHLRQAVDELEDATSSPEIVLAYSHAMEVAGQISPSTLDLLRRTSVRMREVDVDLHWRIEAQMIIAAHFDPELYPLVADQLATPPDDSVRGGSGAGVLLAAWASEETRRGVSRARAVDYARRALQSTLHDPSTRFLAINFLYALTFAGEVEEAARGYEAAIALAQAHGDALTLAILYSSRASLRAQVGNLRGAEEDLRPIERMAFQDAAALQPYWRGYLAELLLERGELAEAQRLVERPTRRGTAGALSQLLSRPRACRVPRRFARAGADGLPCRRRPSHARCASRIPRSRRGGRKPHSPSTASADRRRRVSWHTRSSSSRSGGAPRARSASRCAPSALVEGGRTGEQLLREAVDVLAALARSARVRACARRPRCSSASRQQPQRSQAAAAPGSRARAPMRCKRAGEARQRRAGGDRRACAHDPAHRPRRADGERAAGCAHGGGGFEQQGDRPGAVCDGEDRGAAPRPRLPQARHQLT